MRKRREIPLFSISFLDLLSGALGAVIILYVAIPKNVPKAEDQNVVKSETFAATLKDLNAAKDEVAKLKDEIREKDEKLKELGKPVPALPIGAVAVAESSGERNDLDIGFKFKGKKIVFAIDTSLSMQDEDRIGQVKAGIKMLFTSLPPAYNIDVVQFPQGERAPFKSLFGTVKEANTMNKLDAFDFVYRMRPSGGTPTRDVLLFILKNYEGITDIVLLSDGAPSLHNSNQKDDIYDILRVVRENNPTKIQISTMGVGSDFIKDKTSDRYKFLHSLSEQNNGFFVGF